MTISVTIKGKKAAAKKVVSPDTNLPREHKMKRFGSGKNGKARYKTRSHDMKEPDGNWQKKNVTHMEPTSEDPVSPTDEGRAMKLVDIITINSDSSDNDDSVGKYVLNAPPNKTSFPPVPIITLFKEEEADSDIQGLPVMTLTACHPQSVQVGCLSTNPPPLQLVCTTNNFPIAPPALLEY